MGERYLERIVASGIKIGTIQTLKALGLLPEVVTISQAEKIYGRRLITEWRSKEWIKFYPAKNKERGKYYVKMSELETASAMMDIHNKVPANIIKVLMSTMTAKDIQIGQNISAGFFFRCGHYGDDVDYAIITGVVIRKLECYNQVLVDVDLEQSFNSPGKAVWVRLDKADFNINN